MHLFKYTRLLFPGDPWSPGHFPMSHKRDLGLNLWSYQLAVYSSTGRVFALQAWNPCFRPQHHRKEKYWSWRHSPLIPALGRLGVQGHPRFEISLEYRRLYLKKKKDRKDTASSPSVLERPSLQRRESTLEAMSRYQTLSTKLSITGIDAMTRRGSESQAMVRSTRIQMCCVTLVDWSIPAPPPPTWNAAISNLVAK